MWRFTKKNEKIIGVIAVTFSIIMFFSLIEILISNMSGNSNIFIQPLATVITGFFWVMYGYGKKDWFIITPNLLAIIFGIVTAVSAFI